MPEPGQYLSIGETAARSGVATSALRFYESRGLISSRRDRGNRRHYHRSMLRRIAIIRVAQTLGLSLEEIAAALARLPAGRAPTRRDWKRLSTSWGRALDRRIEELKNLRDRLDGCIGCGCLSLEKCALYNPDDAAGAAVERIAQPFELGDALIEFTADLGGNPGPVTGVGGAPRWQIMQQLADPGEREPQPLGDHHEGQTPYVGPQKPTLARRGALRMHQALLLVVADRGVGEAGAGRQLADADFLCALDHGFPLELKWA